MWGNGNVSSLTPTQIASSTEPKGTLGYSHSLCFCTLRDMSPKKQAQLNTLIFHYKSVLPNPLGLSTTFQQGSKSLSCLVSSLKQNTVPCLWKCPSVYLYSRSALAGYTAHSPAFRQRYRPLAHRPSLRYCNRFCVRQLPLGRVCLTCTTAQSTMQLAG